MTKDFLLQLKNRLEYMIKEAIEGNYNNVHKLINTYERVLDMCVKHKVTETKRNNVEINVDGLKLGNDCEITSVVNEFNEISKLTNKDALIKYSDSKCSEELKTNKNDLVTIKECFIFTYCRPNNCMGYELFLLTDNEDCIYKESYQSYRQLVSKISEYKNKINLNEIKIDGRTIGMDTYYRLKNENLKDIDIQLVNCNSVSNLVKL